MAVLYKIAAFGADQKFNIAAKIDNAECLKLNYLLFCRNVLYTGLYQIGVFEAYVMRLLVITEYQSLTYNHIRINDLESFLSFETTERFEWKIGSKVPWMVL